MKLTTENLTLKTVEAGDIEEVARTWAFEKGPIPAAEAQEAIASMEGNHRKNKPGCIYHLCFAVFETGEKSIIGWCGLDGTTDGKLHIFYLIDAAYRNRGYATQCARKLLEYAFDDAKVPFVNGGCDKDNAHSYKVMKKVGMQEDGFEANGDPLFYMDEALYRISRIGG